MKSCIFTLLYIKNWSHAFQLKKACMQCWEDGNSQDIAQGLRQVILELVICIWTCTGLTPFSSRFHTSKQPLAFPMKNTAGRDKDQHPMVISSPLHWDLTKGPSCCSMKQVWIYYVMFTLPSPMDIQAFSMRSLCMCAYMYALGLPTCLHVATHIFKSFFWLYVQNTRSLNARWELN